VQNRHPGRPSHPADAAANNLAASEALERRFGPSAEPLNLGSLLLQFAEAEKRCEPITYKATDHQRALNRELPLLPFRLQRSSLKP
jgi:hypothetical protein